MTDKEDRYTRSIIYFVLIALLMVNHLRMSIITSKLDAQTEVMTEVLAKYETCKENL